MAFFHQTIGQYNKMTALTTVTLGGTLTDTKIICEVDGTPYYFNVSWVVSDGTYAQANTDADINAQVATFPISARGYSEVKFILVTDSTTFPTITSSDLVVACEQNSAIEPKKTRVKVEVIGLDGLPLQGETVKAKLTQYTKTLYVGSQILGETEKYVESVTNSSGIAYIEVYPNSLITENGVAGNTRWTFEGAGIKAENKNVTSTYEVEYVTLSA